MKNTWMRFVSKIVLLSYVTSILPLNYSFASETVTMTVPSGQGQQAPTLVLRLKAHPHTIPTADYQLKTKRKEVFVAQPGLENIKKNGVEIKLKEKISSDPSVKRKTLYSFFMADDLAFTESFMLQQGLKPVVDSVQNVMGLYWQLNELPDMAVVIGRDGSLAVSGTTNSQKTFQFSSSAQLYLKDFSAAAVHLKAQSLTIGDNVKLSKAAIDLTSPKAKAVIEAGANVSIATVALHQGHLINKGTLGSQGHQAIHLAPGTTFTNEQDLTTEAQITFSGNGQLHNEGTIKSAAIKGKVGSLDNRGHIESNDIDLATLENLTNTGLISAEQSALTSLTGGIYNQGKIIGNQAYHLTVFKKVSNKGSVTGAVGKITTSQGEIINEGALVNANIKATYLKNSETGKIIKGGMVDVAQGENLGSAEVATLAVRGHKFINKGDLSVHSLLGNGQFYSSGTLVFTGTEQNRSQLGVRSFISSAEKGEEASIIGQAVTITPDLHRFIAKNGKVHLGALLIESGNAAAIYQNWAQFKVGHLEMNQLAFDNYGQAVIGDLSGALQTLNNQGYLNVLGETNLANATLTNRDFVDFKGKANLKKVTNLKNLLAPHGLAVTSWENQGNADIQKLFHFQDFTNTGEMALTDAVIEAELPSLINNGELFLTNTFFCSCSGLPFELQNTADLTLAQGAAGLCHLVNDGGGGRLSQWPLRF